MLGGLVTGADNISYIKDAGDNAIIGYAWPLPVRLHGVSDFVLQAPDLYHNVITIPGQMASALNWLINQPWPDAKRISLLGFSQGALAAPAGAGHRRASWNPRRLDLSSLMTVRLSARSSTATRTLKPPWLGKALAPLVESVMFHSLEPTVHWPRVSG